jgi:hypothetical protein
MVYELNVVHNFIKTRRKSHKPTGSSGNFTGLWGKMSHKDQ